MNSAGGACPDGYSAYAGSLSANQRSSVLATYQAPAGIESAILTAPSGFRMRIGLHENGTYYWKVYTLSGPVIYRHTAAGTFKWQVLAGASGGDYTLCIQHP